VPYAAPFVKNFLSSTGGTSKISNKHVLGVTPRLRATLSIHTRELPAYRLETCRSVMLTLYRDVPSMIFDSWCSRARQPSALLRKRACMPLQTPACPGYLYPVMVFSDCDSVAGSFPACKSLRPSQWPVRVARLEWGRARTPSNKELARLVLPSGTSSSYTPSLL